MAPTSCFCWWAQSWCLPCTAASPFSRSARSARRTRSTRWCKILVDFAVSTRRLFLRRLQRSPTASTSSSAPRRSRRAESGYERLTLVKFFFLLHVRRGDPGDHLGRHRRARALPAAVRRDRADRRPRLSVLRRHRLEQATSACRNGSSRPCSAPSSTTSPARVVVHAVGGWIGCSAVLLLGRAPRPLRQGRRDHRASAVVASRSSRWARGCCRVGWFGFNVMSAQTLDKISGLVAVNSLMAMVRRHARAR